MLDIIRNPVVISVILMCVLCLLKLNVLLVLIISSMVGGIAAGMPIDQTMTIFMNGMAGNSETALSYILLGAIAVGIAKTGLMSILSDGMQRVFEGKKFLFIAVIAGISSLSGTIIPVNIAFMPILIPPLIYMMNRMKIDRRAVACALCWGIRIDFPSSDCRQYDEIRNADGDNGDLESNDISGRYWNAAWSAVCCSGVVQKTEGV